MRKFYYIAIIFVLAVLIAGCSGNTGEQAQPIEKPVEELTPDEKVEAVLPTDEPDEVLPTEIPETADTCVVCHIDKQQLIDTAKPEEEVIVENEGAG